MQYYRLDKLINLYDGYRKTLRFDSTSLMLIQHEGKRHLIEARCPHREHPLETATIAGGEIICPLHGYRFNIDTGSLQRASEEPCRGLRTYPIVYKDNEIGVML